MTSFSLAIEPRPEPRLAAYLLIAHAGAAASPWLAHCPPWLAAGASVLALAGLWASLARLPGRHCRLRTLAWDGGGWRLRLADGLDWLPASPTRACRVFAGVMVLEVTAGGRRYGWLLSRGALPPGEFRRLKALIRLAC
ncbi:MAG TPA: hypothetical protein VFR29_02810 [Steroidobacteraceae bacterium]|nr:hypothetical protein [Steroidobacteraceae bacterium]